MKLIDEMQKYRFMYESSFNQIMNLIDKERRQYLDFLTSSNISIVSDRYFSPKKELTKQEVEDLYKIYCDGRK